MVKLLYKYLMIKDGDIIAKKLLCFVNKKMLNSIKNLVIKLKDICIHVINDINLNFAIF